MSNALSILARVREIWFFAAQTTSAASEAAPQPAEMGMSPAATWLSLALAGAGVVTWVIVLIRVAARPGAFSLRRAPLRPNRLNAAMPIILIIVWLGVQVFCVVGAMAVLTAGSGEDAFVSLKSGTPQFATVTILTAIVAALFMLAASAGVMHASFPGGLARGAGLDTRRGARDAFDALLGWLMVWPLYLGLTYATMELLRRMGYPPKSHALLLAFRELGPFWKCTAVVSAVVLAPLAEELFFRGMVQSLLRRAFGRPWTGILITSGLFALMHLTTPQGIPALFVLAVAMGYLYERTGRLVGPIVLHALFNASNILIVALS